MSESKFLNEVEEVTEQLYLAYGSSSGYLFGIEPHLKSAVYNIVKLIIRNHLSEAKVREVIGKCIFESKEDKTINLFKHKDESEVLSVDLLKLLKELGLE